MNVFKTIGAIFIGASLASCGSLPTTATTRIDNPPLVVIADAPEGSIVSIDGAVVGTTAMKDNTYKTSSGRHVVSVRSGGRTLLSEEIFVQDGITRVLNVK